MEKEVRKLTINTEEILKEEETLKEEKLKEFTIASNNLKEENNQLQQKEIEKKEKKESLIIDIDYNNPLDEFKKILKEKLTFNNLEIDFSFIFNKFIKKYLGKTDTEIKTKLFKNIEFLKNLNIELKNIIFVLKTTQLNPLLNEIYILPHYEEFNLTFNLVVSYEKYLQEALKDDRLITYEILDLWHENQTIGVKLYLKEGKNYPKKEYAVVYKESLEDQPIKVIEKWKKGNLIIKQMLTKNVLVRSLRLYGLGFNNIYTIIEKDYIE